VAVSSTTPPSCSQTEQVGTARPLAMHGEKMNTSFNDDNFELEVEVESELNLAESSRPEEATGLPVSEWLADPADTERYEIGLHSLLGAVKEEHEHPTHTDQ
jgi:hypothetical protein